MQFRHVYMNFRQNFSQKKKYFRHFRKKTLAETVNCIPKGLRKGNPFHGPFAQLSYTFTVSTGVGCCPQPAIMYLMTLVHFCSCVFRFLNYNILCSMTKLQPETTCPRLRIQLMSLKLTEISDPTRIPLTSSLSGSTGGCNTSGLLLELLHEWLALLLLLWI